MKDVSKPSYFMTIGMIIALFMCLFAMKFGYSKVSDVHTGEIIGKVYTTRCDEEKKTCTTTLIYSINNTQYTGVVVTPDPSPYIINKPVSLYYDPKNPKDVVVSPPPIKMGFFIIIFALLVFLNIFWYLYVQYRLWSYFSYIKSE